jgi:NADH-quinone oxidoreductase subunit H
LLVFVQIWVRWTLPRLRIDQVMTSCLKYLVPISCFLFLGAVLWPLILVSAIGRTTLLEGPMSPPLGSKVSSKNEPALVGTPQLTAFPLEEGRQ